MSNYPDIIKKYLTLINKQFMKNDSHFACIAIVLFSILQFNTHAQTPHIDLTYDAAGNRVLRGYSPMRLMDTTKHDPEAEQTAMQHGITVYPNPAAEGNVINVMISAPGNKTAAAATVFLLDNNGKI